MSESFLNPIHLAVMHECKFLVLDSMGFLVLYMTISFFPLIPRFIKEQVLGTLLVPGFIFLRYWSDKHELYIHPQGQWLSTHIYRGVFNVIILVLLCILMLFLALDLLEIVNYFMAVREGRKTDALANQSGVQVFLTLLMTLIAAAFFFVIIIHLTAICVEFFIALITLIIYNYNSYA